MDFSRNSDLLRTGYVAEITRPPAQVADEPTEGTWLTYHGALETQFASAAAGAGPAVIRQLRDTGAESVLGADAVFPATAVVTESVRTAITAADEWRATTS